MWCAELGQPDAHQCARAFTGTARPDATLVLLDDVATDEQAQAHARDLQLFSVGRAAEWLEDPVGSFGW